MGEVYRAEDTDLGRAVALKVLPEALVADADRLARFVQEARTASSLNHPHLVAIYEIGKGVPAGTGFTATDAVHFIAMELVAGETLRHVIEHLPRDLRRTLDYCGQAADALSAAHGAGIVHRDFKPENVMVAAAGYVKILDFGLAKLRADQSLLGAGTEATTMAKGTAPWTVMGTLGYMSPEQAQGRPLDPRSDIFAFGCVLYEAATGTRAFSGTSAVETLHQIINVDPPPVTSRLDGAPMELQRIVAKCLAKDPEERYQSMKEVSIDLKSLRRQLDSGPATTTAAQPAVSPRRGLTPAIAIGAAIAFAAIVGAWLWSGRQTAKPAEQALNIQRLTASGLVIDAVLSADGKYITYVESSGGRQSLWLRQVGGTRPIELVPPAEVGYWGVAFSRDGQSILYGLKSNATPNGTLFQIPILGGPQKTLLTGIDSTVTVSPDGARLAFYRIDSATAASSLVVANADGTNAKTLFTRKPPEFLAPGFFVAPSWSPDGKRIAVMVRSSATRDAGLMTVDVEGGAEHAFPERYDDGTCTFWLPDGSGIAYIGRPRGMFGTGNGGQIFVQPFPSGPVRRITNDLVEYRNVSLSADGKQLLSVGFDVSVRLSILDWESKSERLLPSERYDGGRGLTWSPDGRRVLFSRVTGGISRIWTMAADGTHARELVSEGLSAWPAISPDGRILVFTSSRGNQIGVWRAEADGSQARLLTAVIDATFLTFAPDGKSVYFASSKDGPPSTYRISIDGGSPSLVASFFDRPGLSPDGGLLAGIYRETPTASVSLGILDAGTGKPVKVFPDFPVNIGSGSIAWTADGSAVIYTTGERFNIWRRPLAGGEPQKVTNFSDLAIIRFAPSPNGNQIALTRGTQTRDAFLLTGFR
jgi:Tol biopolymer transport system component